LSDRLGVLRRIAKRPTVSPRRVASFLGLISAFSIGLLIRLQMAKYGYYLDEFDSYFHYMSTSIIVNDINTKGLAGLFDFFKVVNYQFWYPLGYNLATNTFAGFYYSSALLYEFIHRVLGVNISLYDYLVIQQAYIASFIAFPVYLIGKRIYNSTAGILAAMFAAITPGYLSRSDLGWYKHEPFSMLGGTFALYFLIASYDSVNRRRSLMYAMLCGLFLGYSNVSWGGGQYFNGIVGVSLFAIPLLLSSDYNRAINGIVITVVDLAVGMAFPNPGWSWLTNTSMFVLYAGSFGGLALTFIAKKLPDRNKITGKWIATIAFAGLGVVAVLYGPFSHISARYLSVILPFARSIVPAVQTVAEQQPSSGVQILYYYLALIFFGIFGGYALLRRRKPYSVIIAILAVSALYVASSFARLQVFTSIGIAIVAGFGIAELSGRMFSLSPPKLKTRGTSPVSVAKGFFVLMITIMMIVSAMTVWVPFGNRGYAITSSALSNSNFYYPDWLQALSWISQNTPANAKIISWWDYGYWISVMGNRTTFIDNGTLNSTRMAEVATLFLSNQSYASKLVADMGGDYVVVFLTLRQVGGGYYTLGRVYNLGGDDGKIDAMATIAGINLTKAGFLNPANLMPTRAFYANTTIGRMFDINFTGYGVFSPSTGQLISIYPDYQNSTTITQNYIQLPLFTLNQNYPPGSSPFELVFNSNPTGAAYTQGVVAQVLIYKYNPVSANAALNTNSSKG
jgi:dolichyl-diphosphooligosaccharide--protein glycosyltransferase